MEHVVLFQLAVLAVAPGNGRFHIIVASMYELSANSIGACKDFSRILP